MMVRPIEKDDFTKFAKAGGYLKQYAGLVERWSEKGNVDIDDCFVFYDSDVPLGGVCFNDATETELYILDFEMSPIVENGHEYLRQALTQAVKHNTMRISYNLYDDTEQYADIQKLFLQAGFIIRQKKRRFIHEVIEYTTDTMLTFKSIVEVGEKLFTETVERVTFETLDSLMADDWKTLGSNRAAKEYVASLKEMDFNPEMWLLAYDGDTLIGLIITQRFDETYGAINYIGVLPEYRGRGYGSGLVIEGVRLLKGASVDKIIADIDVENKPLAAQLERVGFESTMEEVVLIYTR
jgi:ribosomal protein S18 acetylase RimI-like enzyme